MQQNLLETVILEVENQPLIAAAAQTLAFGKRQIVLGEARDVLQNPDATRSGVPGAIYDAYRRGLASACADVVLVKITGDIPAVPLIRRKKPPFQDCWWLMGGSIFTHRPIHQFLLWKALAETGIEGNVNVEQFVEKHNLQDEDCSLAGISIIGCLGVCRTVAEDMEGTGRVCDTINLCYLGLVQREYTLFPDKDHTDVQWLSGILPGSCNHWYPEWAARKALAIVNVAVGRAAMLAV